MKYLCEVRYVGTAFCGFQAQPNRRTVQGTLTEAANTVFGLPCAVTGCSRTDSGVHAKGFACTVALPTGQTPIPPEKLPIALSLALPSDVAVTAARVVCDGFHPRYDAKSKEYRYRMYRTAVCDPFEKNRAWYVRTPFLPDAAERMQRAGLCLIGTHDFRSFMAKDDRVIENTVRTIYDCTVTKEGSLYTLSIRGDGFLYNMVRILAGTLSEVAMGKRQPEDMLGILAAKDRTAAGATAPPGGLYLHRVFYDENDFLKEIQT